MKRLLNILISFILLGVAVAYWTRDNEEHSTVSYSELPVEAKDTLQSLIRNCKSDYLPFDRRLFCLNHSDFSVEKWCIFQFNWKYGLVDNQTGKVYYLDSWSNALPIITTQDNIFIPQGYEEPPQVLLKDIKFTKIKIVKRFSIWNKTKRFLTIMPFRVRRFILGYIYFEKLDSISSSSVYE